MKMTIWVSSSIGSFYIKIRYVLNLFVRCCELSKIFSELWKVLKYFVWTWFVPPPQLLMRSRTYRNIFPHLPTISWSGHIPRRMATKTEMRRTVYDLDELTSLTARRPFMREQMIELKRSTTLFKGTTFCASLRIIQGMLWAGLMSCTALVLIDSLCLWTWD